MLVFFFFFKKSPCCFAYFLYAFAYQQGRKEDFFFSKPSAGLSFSRSFDTGLSEQYEVIPRGGFDWPHLGR